MTAPGYPRLYLAIAAILLADATLTFNDALVNLHQGGLGLSAVFWLRGLVAVPILAAIVWFGRGAWMPARPGWVIVRSGLLLCSWVALYTGFKYLPIANAVAGTYTNPIMIVALTALMDRRNLAPVQWISVCIGFLGALLIVQPGGDGVIWAYVFPLISALTYAVAMVLTNRRLPDEDPKTVSLWMNALFLIAGGCAVWLHGDAPVAVAVQILGQNPLPFLLMGLCIACAGIFVTFAFQNGPAPLISTFDYCYLLFAILWGFVFFGQFPNALALCGMAMIVGAGVLILWAQARQSNPTGADLHTRPSRTAFAFRPRRGL